MRGEYEELICPFCDKGRIQCWHIPSIWSEKIHKTATFGSGKIKTRSPDVWLIKSGCNVCGKTQEEVEEELKKKDII